MGDLETDLPPEKPRRDDSTIPVPVVLSAFYQFAKAGYLLYVFWVVHKAALAGTSGADPGDALVLALPVFALIMFIAGLGLLALRPWARHILLAGGALALPWLPLHPMRLQWGPIVTYGALQPYLPRAVMMTIMVIDVVVYATLVCYPDVADAFGEKGGDPYYSGE